MSARDTARPTLNSTEVARLYGITRATLYRWLKQGKIPEPATDPVTKQMVWTQTEVDAISKFLKGRELA